MSSTKSELFSEPACAITHTNNMPKYKYRFYEFEGVPVEGVKELRIDIHNESEERKEYEIFRYPEGNVLDSYFSVVSNNYVAEPHKSFTFTIRYAPKTPNSVNFDYFNVYDKNGNCCLKFGVKGTSVGPALRMSVRKLTFSCKGDDSMLRRTIRLQNDSPVAPAQFQFVGVGARSVFTVDVTHGTVRPGAYIYVCITFAPLKPGAFFKNLHCLVHYQAPLLLSLEGVWSTSGGSTSSRGSRLPMPGPLHASLFNGFEGFMADVSRVARRKRPPLSLSTSAIDFGFADASGTEPALPVAVTITSHVQVTVDIYWDQDVHSAFAIYPDHSTLPGNDVAKFKVYFRPREAKKFFFVELEATCSTKVGITKANYMTYITAPYNMTLSLLGHSFPKCEPPAVARPPLLDPPSVLLVARAPPLPAYATLVVHRRGPPPLMFKFIPPPKSNFEVKPQQGIMETKFQIVVVQLIPSPCKEIYMESWRLQLNGSDKNEVAVMMVGHAEHPAVEVGVKNVVTLPPTFPGCLQILRVPLWNFTRQCVRYYLCVLNNVQTVKVEDPYGSIASNEVLYTTWHFRPPVQGYYKVTLLSEVTAVDCQGTALSCKTETAVMAHGLIDLTFLTVFPDTLSLGTLSWGCQGCDSLLLVNPGRAPIHFTLRTAARSALTVPNDLTLAPSFGTLEAGARLSVQVLVRPRETGLHLVDIGYRVRRGPDAEEPFLPMPERPLSSVTYYCEVPNIKVVDIRVVDPGPLYSKAALWDLIGLDRLCEALHDGEACSEYQVDLKLPEAVVGSAPLQLGLLLRAAGRLPVEWRLRRCKVCDCQPEEVCVGISRRRMVLRCPHREVLDLQPRAGCLTVQHQQVLYVEARYELEGTTQLVWELSLPAGRVLLLRWRLVALPPTLPLPTLYRDVCSLGHVYVGDLSPVAEVVWLYNATSQKAAYQVDAGPLEALGRRQGYQPLCCLNPSGLLPPSTAWPLLFRLAPTQLRHYSETVEVSLGSGECALRRQLRVSGDGVVSRGGGGPASHAPACCLFHQLDEVPAQAPPPAPAPPVRLSTDLITLHALPTFTVAHRIFFINNTTPDTIYSYKWQQPLRVEGVAEVVVEPAEGRLAAGASHCVRLEVRSLGVSCRLTLPLPCRLLNVTARCQHEKSLVVLTETQRLLQGHFTITEHGTFYPEPDVKVEPPPKPLHVVLGIEMHTVNAADIDAKLSLRDQLRAAPQLGLGVATATGCFPYAQSACPHDADADADAEADIPPEATLNAKTRPAVAFVLERILWRVVHSKRLSAALDVVRSGERPRRYAQFRMPAAERARLQARSCAEPARAAVAHVLRNALLHILHREFDLGPLRAEDLGCPPVHKATSQESDSQLTYGLHS